MALITIYDQYKSFLKGIGKKRTSAVWPSDFNVIINEAYKEWLRTKVNEADLTQQRIDDLQKLRYLTDSSIEILISSVETTTLSVVGETYNSVTGVKVVKTLFDNYPTWIVKTYQRLIPIKPVSGTNDLFLVLPANYPAYYRLQSIQAMVTLDGIDYGYIGSKPMKADRKSEILKDPYKKPYLDIRDQDRSRIYHEYVQDNLHLFLPSGAIGKNILIEYIKNPTELFFDPNNSANNINCELGSDQQQQIVDIAVRSFIEQVESRRYQTVVNEDQIKQRDK